MKIKMSQEEWDNKFKHIEKGKRDWIYRDHHGFYNDIVKFGLFPAFVIVDVNGTEKVMQICHVVSMPDRSVPGDQRYMITSTLVHAAELSLPREDLLNEKGLHVWITECDYWFDTLDPQEAFELTRSPTSHTPKQIWDSWDLDFKNRLWKKSVEANKIYVEETKIDAEIPGLQTSEKIIDDESKRIRTQILVDDEKSAAICHKHNPSDQYTGNPDLANCNHCLSKNSDMKQDEEDEDMYNLIKETAIWGRDKKAPIHLITDDGSAAICHKHNPSDQYTGNPDLANCNHCLSKNSDMKQDEEETPPPMCPFCDPDMDVQGKCDCVPIEPKKEKEITSAVPPSEEAQLPDGPVDHNKETVSQKESTESEIPSEEEEVEELTCESCGGDVTSKDPFCPTCKIEFTDGPNQDEIPEVDYTQLNYRDLCKYAKTKGIKGRTSHEKLLKKLDKLSKK